MGGLEIRDSVPGKIGVLPRGILDPRGSASRIRVNRYEPSPAFAPFIDHVWIGDWNLVGRPPEKQRVLPSPNAHLVIGSGYTSLFGVVRGIYSRQLHGSGRVLGVRFRTGGLRPFLNGPMAALTDRTVPAKTLTGLEDCVAEARVHGIGDDRDMVQAAEALIEPRLPAPDPNVDLVCAIICGARRHDGPRQAKALAGEAGLSLRTLQRLFHEYVGVSPKWVIRRYRLQEAARWLAQGEQLPLARLAAELDYFDQAHLARDFARLFGCPPAEYRRMQILSASNSA
jgi:AraC-like DNA-binding protein